MFLLLWMKSYLMIDSSSVVVVVVFDVDNVDGDVGELIIVVDVALAYAHEASEHNRRNVQAAAEQTAVLVEARTPKRDSLPLLIVLLRFVC